MNSIEASIRNTKTKGEINSLRQKGEVPAIVYGGTEENQKISLSKKQVQYLIDQENFLSKIISVKIDDKSINVLPRAKSESRNLTETWKWDGKRRLLFCAAWGLGR